MFALCTVFAFGNKSDWKFDWYKKICLPLIVAGETTATDIYNEEITSLSARVCGFRDILYRSSHNSIAPLAAGFVHDGDTHWPRCPFTFARVIVARKLPPILWTAVSAQQSLSISYCQPTDATLQYHKSLSLFIADTSPVAEYKVRLWT